MKQRICALAAFGALAGPVGAQAPSPAQLPFVLKQVAPGVYAAIDGPEHKAGSNAGFVVGDDRVLMVNIFFTLESTWALLAQPHSFTTKPIRYVVKSHYHFDHTGGDQALRNA